MLRYPFTPTPPQNTCRSLVRKYNCISSSWYLGTYTLEITKFYLYVTNWCTAAMKNKRTLFSVVNKYSHKGRTSASYQGTAFKKNNAKISGKFYHYIRGLTFVVLFSFQKWVQFVEHLKFIPVTACYLFRLISILSNQRPLIFSNIYHFWNTREKTCSISREVVKDHERFAVSHASRTYFNYHIWRANKMESHSIAYLLSVLWGIEDTMLAVLYSVPNFPSIIYEKAS